MITQDPEVTGLAGGSIGGLGNGVRISQPFTDLGAVKPLQFVGTEPKYFKIKGQLLQFGNLLDQPVVVPFCKLCSFVVGNAIGLDLRRCQVPGDVDRELL